jgi:hypothetical protein
VVMPMGPDLKRSGAPPPRDAPPDAQPLSRVVAAAIVADPGDDQDQRRARTVRRLAAIELVDLHYGRVPRHRWCRHCHGECQVVSA